MAAWYVLSSTYRWLNSSADYQPYLQSLEIFVQILLIEQRELHKAKFRAVTLVAGKNWVDQIFCWSLQTFCSCSLPPLPVIQTVIKYLVNLLWINVNQIECKYSRTLTNSNWNNKDIHFLIITVFWTSCPPPPRSRSCPLVSSCHQSTWTQTTTGTSPSS